LFFDPNNGQHRNQQKVDEAMAAAAAAAKAKAEKERLDAEAKKLAEDEAAREAAKGGGGGGGGGGGCFTDNSLILVSGQTLKKISEIKVGDYVYSKDYKTLNKVTFIECVLDTQLKYLYSPTEDIAPFATINHPIYINGKLTAVDYSINPIEYPWLKIEQTIIPPKIIPAQGKLVYNLWVDGDGTYIVNGYPTTSIIGDGGILRLLFENGEFTYDQTINVLMEFINGDPDLLLGIYNINKFSGKIGKIYYCKPLNKYFGMRLRDNSYPKTKKNIFQCFKFIGKIVRKLKK
jgi:hypothetical protein